MTPNGNGELDAVYDDTLPGRRPPPRKSRRGLIVATVATLIFVPAVFSLLHRHSKPPELQPAE